MNLYVFCGAKRQLLQNIGATSQTSKLYKLAVTISVRDINEWSDSSTTSSHQWVEYERGLDSKQLNLLKLISKNTLLVGVAIFVVQVYLCFEWVELYKKNNFGWDVWSYYLCARWILRSVMMTIEILAMYLSFAANRTCFNFLCGGCQNGLQSCCQTRMKKTIRRKTTVNESKQSLLRNHIQMT